METDLHDIETARVSDHTGAEKPFAMVGIMASSVEMVNIYLSTPAQARILVCAAIEALNLLEPPQ